MLEFARPGLCGGALLGSVQLLLLSGAGTFVVVLCVRALGCRGTGAIAIAGSIVCGSLIAAAVATTADAAFKMLGETSHDKVARADRALGSWNFRNGAVSVTLLFLGVRHDCK